MGIRILIDGEPYEAAGYTVTEESSPTSSDDSSGSVGTISFDLKQIEFPFLLEGLEVSFADTRKGTTVGYVSSVDESDHGDVSVTCLTRLGKLNIYDVQAQPFIGTLQDAFRYYVSLAGQVVDILIDPQIAGRPVVFQGWYGELWYHLKQFAAAQDCEISLVSNVILLRPLRSREAVDHRNITRARSYGGTALARAVEVYTYNNHEIEDELVYPPGGWTPETEVIAVGAGETTERVLELSASVSSIQEPTMVTSVDPHHSTSSVYTIVGDDGLPIQPAQWRDMGGRLDVRINDDTTSLTVRVTAPEGIQGIRGEPISTYSVALGADFTGNRYSTLRIIGTGVAFEREVIRVRTCVPDQATGTDVGITIDNPFLSTMDEAYRAGVRAARWFAGEKMTLSGSVTSINQLGESGVATYPKYSFDQSQWDGMTYGAVEVVHSSRTYGEIERAYYDVVRDDFENQLFGNANGARTWDRKSRRWYRIRTADITPGEIAFTAEDDLIHEDVQWAYEHHTYAQEEDLFSGRTYSQRDRMGLYMEERLPPTGGLYPSTILYPSSTLFPEDS